MIRINLSPEALEGKGRAKAPRLEGTGALGQNVLMISIVVLCLVFISWRWYSLSSEHTRLLTEIASAEQEKQRLEAIIQKGKDYKVKKDLLQRKISLVSELKRNQSGPVHLLDEVSKQLPDFLWLSTMNESGFRVQIQGKATTYNAVSNFYNNMTRSGYFQDVVLGPITAVAEGVTFSMTCQFLPEPVARLAADDADGVSQVPAGT